MDITIEIKLYTNYDIQKGSFLWSKLSAEKLGQGWFIQPYQDLIKVLSQQMR